ncbi:uncharacterized protein ARMOST_02297 [Armillaria ostoyae]|uniref:Uncharacterized protein n=1 Tax=Armillaria ostoyae TaxID=47428 RepID=A0A284QRC3_ARMOS|nr:uncharacterized protein ARMOST_02297 [Armillaria ostoyae]
MYSRAKPGPEDIWQIGKGVVQPESTISSTAAVGSAYMQDLGWKEKEWGAMVSKITFLAASRGEKDR